MKVITFSTEYPNGIACSDRLTWFPEKIWANFPQEQVEHFYNSIPADLRNKFFSLFAYEQQVKCNWIKGTTIRAGRRWKTGDKFSPRIWTGKPYNSKQLAIWPELTVLKVEVFERNPYGNFFLNGRFLGDYQIDKIAEHDGLGPAPFRSWFNKEFSGQRIIFGQTALNYSIF